MAGWEGGEGGEGGEGNTEEGEKRWLERDPSASHWLLNTHTILDPGVPPRIQNLYFQNPPNTCQRSRFAPDRFRPGRRTHRGQSSS